MRRRIARKHGRCTSGKVQYRSEDDARLAITRARQRADGKHLPIRAYHCPNCGSWHTTSQQER